MSDLFKSFMNLQLFAVSPPTVPIGPVAQSTDAALAPEFKTFYERTLLERLLPNLVFAQFGQKKPIPKRGGKTIEFRRFTALPQANFQLVEGVTPTGQTAEVTSITASVLQHGNFMALTDIVDLTALDDQLAEYADLLGEQAGLYIDTLVRDVIMAGTNVMYAPKMKYNNDGLLVRDTAAVLPTARNQISNLHPLSVDAIRIGKRIMGKNRVKPYKGSRSQTGRGEFVLICDGEGLYDVENDKKWIDVKVYQDKGGIYEGEIGKIYGVRIVVTDNAKVYEGGGSASGGAQPFDVHGALMLGSNAFGVVDISGSATPEFIVKPIGSAGANDPLNQRGTTGWKVLFTTRILEDLALLRIEHGFTEDLMAAGY